MWALMQQNPFQIPTMRSCSFYCFYPFTKNTIHVHLCQLSKNTIAPPKYVVFGVGLFEHETTMEQVTCYLLKITMFEF